MRSILLILSAAGLCALAQDAGMVLRTSVGYRTQKASRPLTAEQKKEADRLEALAVEANRDRKYGEAMRNLYHGLTLMNGAEWTPALEMAAALQAKADHAILAPGNSVRVSLTALYPVDQTLDATIVLRPVEGEGETVLAQHSEVKAAGLPASIVVKLPAGASGDQFLETRLADADGMVDPKARLYFVKRTPIRIEDLTASAERLRVRLAQAAASKSPALPTAEYAAALYDRADHGDVSPHRIDFAKQFAEAESIAAAAVAGRNPFANKGGDLRKAYRSAIDNTLQPYRLFIPGGYDGKSPAPLVVALHGMGGDENSMLDLYNGAVKREAARAGFLVVCPKGRDSASMYSGAAETDVLDVLAEVRRDYKVDSSRVYLMGHSMGGFGTWSIAMRHPGIWASLGPISGGGNPSGMAAIKHIPEYVVHGDNDKTVPVAMSRAMVEAGKKAGAEIKYVEVLGGSHVDIAVPQFGAMFDFFAAHPKPEAGAEAQVK